MESLPNLENYLLIAAIGVFCVVVLGSLRLPVVTGLLAAGALAGPYGFSLVSRTSDIHILAQIGVVMLLFTIGLEFSPRRLAKNIRLVAWGGILQTGLTILVVAAASFLLDFSFNKGLFLGFVIAVSSTAIVLRSLEERGELHAPHGEIIVGTLIFQDLCVVPMMLLIPLLAGHGSGGSGWAVAIVFAKAMALTGGVFIGARILLPLLFSRVETVGGRDVFLLTVLLVLMSIVWLTAKLGLSVALGAFLAGLMLADSSWGKRALHDMLSLRDVFMSLFFISLGMLFDYQMLLSHPVLVGLLLAGFLFGKGLVAMLAARFMRFPWQVALLAGFGLAQFGEFGYVLMAAGRKLGLLTDPEMNSLIAAGVLSMFITPVFARLMPRFLTGDRILLPLELLLGGRRLMRGNSSDCGVLVLGYGDRSRLLCEKLLKERISFAALDWNPEKVEEGKMAGHLLFYGDITSEDSLTRAGLKTAQCAALLVSQPQTIENTLPLLARLKPGLPVLLWAHTHSEREYLFNLRGKVSIVDSLETLLSFIRRALKNPLN